MKFEPDRVKGFQDFLPPESLKRQAIRKVIEKWMQRFGFLPIETPIIEFEELMHQNTQPNEQPDEAISDRFKLKDRGARNLGLRYEFTFQLARIFKQNPTIKLPFRRYQIGEVFRDEPIGPNRFRQFTQCDADIIGDPSPIADTECLALVAAILNELRINAEIQVNNRKLLAAIIESVEIEHAQEVMKELDKIEKLGIDQTKIKLKRYATTNQIITLFKLLEKDISFFKENAFAGTDELQELIDHASLYNIKIKPNPSLARGLSYYTGNIFEIKEQGKEAIAAGGRYDKTVGIYLGKEIPAVGISFGLERLTNRAALSYEKIPKVMIISINQKEATIKLAKKLRSQNIATIIELNKTGKALEYANAYTIPFVIFLGHEEIKQKKFKIREMSSGKESLLTEAQIIKAITK